MRPGGSIPFARPARLAERAGEIGEDSVEREREAGGGGARRGLAGGEQSLDSGGGPDRGLGGERVEPAPGDRQCAVIGMAQARRLVEPAIGAREPGAAGDPPDQLQSLAQLRELAAGVGGGDGGGGGRWMGQGARLASPWLRKS